MAIRSVTPAGQRPTVTFIVPEEWMRAETRREGLSTPTPELIATLAFAAEGVGESPLFGVVRWK